MYCSVLLFGSQLKLVIIIPNYNFEFLKSNLSAIAMYRKLQSNKNIFIF